MSKLFQGVVQSVIETNNQGPQAQDSRRGSRSGVAVGHPPGVVD
jgi:hypothetical protein